LDLDIEPRGKDEVLKDPAERCAMELKVLNGDERQNERKKSHY
jgi:hypothetical protein